MLRLVTKFVRSSLQAMLRQVNSNRRSSVPFLDGHLWKPLNFRHRWKYETVTANAPCFEHPRSGSDNMHISGSASSQPQARDPRRIGPRLLSPKSTQHNFAKLVKRRSLALAPATFKRSQAIGSTCEVVQQELRMFLKPSEDRRSDRNKCAVPISKVPSKCSHLWDFYEVKVRQVQKSPFLQVQQVKP